jgi:hypothetical protein
VNKQPIFFHKPVFDHVRLVQACNDHDVFQLRHYNGAQALSIRKIGEVRVRSEKDNRQDRQPPQEYKTEAGSQQSPR